MTTTTHTPAPWVIKGNDAINAGPIQIAYFLNDRIGIKEAKANAHLIAASPLLLEELSKLSIIALNGGCAVPESVYIAIAAARGQS